MSYGLKIRFGPDGPELADPYGDLPKGWSIAISGHSDDQLVNIGANLLDADGKAVVAGYGTGRRPS
ncbi:MAG TPA: hypothetical protein VEH31_43865 [Streptosporangiaceae bacterium]|nr:hypothetical protein [Streptosporangiaceae bacterium]